MALLVVGGGGFGREAWEYATQAEGKAPDGFLDDDPRCLDGTPWQGRWTGTIQDFRPGPHDRLVLAIGIPEVRRRLAALLEGKGAQWATTLHPTAVVSPTAKVGPGCILAPFSFVGPRAELAPLTVLNTYASIGHDARTGARAILCPYATANGNARLGADVFLGTHATVSPGVSVGDGSKLSAGAVALRDIPAGSLAVGNPAQSRVMFR